MRRASVPVCAALALLLLLAAPPALAGSAASPEIDDPVGEVEVHASSGTVNVPSPEIDIDAVWFTANATTLRIHFAILDLSASTFEEEDLVFALTYGDEANPFADVMALRDERGWTFSWSNATRGLALDGQVEGDLIAVDLPRHLLSGTLTRVTASSILSVKLGPLGNHADGPVWYRDWAPGDGYGPDVDPDQLASAPVVAATWTSGATAVALFGAVAFIPLCVMRLRRR